MFNDIDIESEMFSDTDIDDLSEAFKIDELIERYFVSSELNEEIVLSLKTLTYNKLAIEKCRVFTEKVEKHFNNDMNEFQNMDVGVIIKELFYIKQIATSIFGKPIPLPIALYIFYYFSTKISYNKYI
jgi:hypothetical protein